MRSLLLATGIAMAACATPRAGDDAAQSLAAAESAFAAHSLREDMRAAFMAHFADDGVLVGPEGWVVSTPYLAARPAPPIVLAWKPTFVEVAASGELGLSTGPSRITSRSDASRPPVYGQFVSVWRRAGNGPWKVEADLGIRHPEPALWDAPLVARSVAPSHRSDAGSVQRAEAAFDAAARQGTHRAYAAHAADDVRVYRDGFSPLLGKSAVEAHAAFAAERLEWRVEHAATSAAGDLAYVRGAYVAEGKVAGHYLRVWRREAAGWRILADVVNPRR